MVTRKLKAKAATAKLAESPDETVLDLSKFPLEDSGIRIDASFQEPRKFRVYYWTERPDAAEHVEGDKEHWHPDSEHDTFESARARAADLKGGAKAKSLYLHPAEPGPTKH